jgi:hypothetical protein
MVIFKHSSVDVAHLKTISDWQHLCKRDFAELVHHPSLPPCPSTAHIKQTRSAANNTSAKVTLVQQKQRDDDGGLVINPSTHGHNASIDRTGHSIFPCGSWPVRTVSAYIDRLLI